MIRAFSLAACAGVAMMAAGCSNGREINLVPGDCYCQLSRPEVTLSNGELRFKVHYHFPDGPPRIEAWFVCTFDINGTSMSSVSVRKQGRELMDEGEFEAATSAQFFRSFHGSFAVTVKQGASKSGPFREVSSRLVANF